MSVMSALQAVLYVISTLLLYPVMACLVAIFAYTLYAAGGFLAEWAGRRRSTFHLDTFLEKLIDFVETHFPASRDAAPCCAPALPAGENVPRPLHRFLAEVLARLGREDAEPDPEIAFCLRAEEERIGKAVDRLRMIVKIGPSLGLLGTLIPMGTALASLAQGNLEGMANNLIIAFTTTVVGLAAGTVAYVMTSARARWAAEELNRLQYVAERLSAALAKDRAEVRA